MITNGFTLIQPKDHPILPSATNQRWVRTAWNEDVCSSTHSFARTTHSFARSVLLISVANSAVLVCSLANSLVLWKRKTLESIFRQFCAIVQCLPPVSAIRILVLIWRISTSISTLFWNKRSVASCNATRAQCTFALLCIDWVINNCKGYQVDSQLSTQCHSPPQQDGIPSHFLSSFLPPSSTDIPSCKARQRRWLWA